MLQGATSAALPAFVSRLLLFYSSPRNSQLAVFTTLHHTSSWCSLLLKASARACLQRRRFTSGIMPCNYTGVTSLSYTNKISHLEPGHVSYAEQLHQCKPLLFVNLLSRLSSSSAGDCRWSLLADFLMWTLPSLLQSGSHISSAHLSHFDWIGLESIDMSSSTSSEQWMANS